MVMYKDCVVIHNRKDLKPVKQIEFRRGLCAADPKSPDAPRDYDSGIKKLEWKINRGLIDDGSKTPYDDRKIRYSSSEVAGNCLVIYLGVTDWGEYRKYYDMPMEESLDLQNHATGLGLDRYAFHSRAIGPTAMLKTHEGSIPVGVRSNPIYQDFVHGPIASFFRFKTIDDCIRLNEKSSGDALREEIEWGMKQELGLEPAMLVGDAELFGVSCHPKTGEVDISLLQRTNVSEDYFINNEWKSRVAEPKEYTEIFLLHSIKDAYHVIHKFQNILYPTRLILESLTPEDFKPGK